MKLYTQRMYKLLIAVFITSSPLLAFAQVTTPTPPTATVTNAQGLFAAALIILNYYLVPLIFGLAFLMFLWGVYRYFIAGGGNAEKVQEGQKFVLWSVIGFVLMFTIWGIINLLINTLGFDTTSRPAFPTFGSGTTGSSFFSGGDTSNLFGQTGGSQGSLGAVGSTYNDPIGGGSYPVTGPNTVQQVNGNCPANFSQTGGNQCLSNISTGAGETGVNGSCTQDGDCTGELACLPVTGSPTQKTCQTDPSLENAGGYGQAAGTVTSGGTCKTNDDCAGNLACSDNNVCTTDGSLDGPGYGDGDGTVLQGGACENADDCNGGLICTNGICATDPELDGNGTTGSGCSNNNQCIGTDAAAECINGTCQADDGLGQQGEGCGNDDNECEGDLACINGSCQVDQNLDSGDGYTDPDQGGGDQGGGGGD